MLGPQYGVKIVHENKLKIDTPSFKNHNTGERCGPWDFCSKFTSFVLEQNILKEHFETVVIIIFYQVQLSGNTNLSQAFYIYLIAS